MPLSPPPHDRGRVVPHDHAEILGEDDLIRRISQEHIVPDGRGGRRISSMAFQASGEDGGMSVDIKKSIEEAGLVATHFVTTPKWFGSVIFKTEIARAQQLLVGYDPIPGNDHHGQVWGKFSKAKSKAIQRAAVWFVAIDGVAVV